MSFLVATNVIASRPPERRPTGTPHARANCIATTSFKQIRRYMFSSGLQLQSNNL